MLKNVSLLLIILSLLLMSNLYSKAKLDQSSSPYASIEKYQSLIIDFQLIAEYLNPVDINDSRADICLSKLLEKNIIFPAFCFRHIFNMSKMYAQLSLIKEKHYSYKIPMKNQRDAVFAKTFSLNVIALIPCLEKQETKMLPVNSSKMN